jgi:hypothetical protein
MSIRHPADAAQRSRSAAAAGSPLDHALGGYKPGRLGSLRIEGCRRSTSKPSVSGTDQTLSEIGSRILKEDGQPIPSPSSTGELVEIAA